MALVNRVWREARYVPEGAEPGLFKGRPFRENVQNGVVHEIAHVRFPYPSKEEPELKTYVNRPDHTVGVRTASGDLLFPDIVVMNTANTEVEMLGEVETTESLRADDVIDKWRAFNGVGPLYVFVPLSAADRARSLVKSSGLHIKGLRAWRGNMGRRTVEVLDLLG